MGSAQKIRIACAQRFRVGQKFDGGEGPRRSADDDRTHQKVSGRRGHAEHLRCVCRIYHQLLVVRVSVRWGWFEYELCWRCNRTFQSNMEEFLELKERMNKHFKLAAEPIGGLIGMYPWLGNFPFFSRVKNGWSEPLQSLQSLIFAVVLDNWKGLMEMFRKQAMEKLATLDYDSDEYSDYVEAFLKERKKHEHEPNYGGFEWVWGPYQSHLLIIFQNGTTRQCLLWLVGCWNGNDIEHHLLVPSLRAPISWSSEESLWGAGQKDRKW